MEGGKIDLKHELMLKHISLRTYHRSLCRSHEAARALLSSAHCQSKDSTLQQNLFS